MNTSKKLCYGLVASTLLTCIPHLYADTNKKPSREEVRSVIEKSIGDNNEVFLTSAEKIMARSIILADIDVENRVGLLDEYMKYNGVSTKGTTYFAEYDKNEIKADSIYKGKEIYIKGLVKGINKDITGNPFLSLNGAGYLQDTVARFENSEDNIEYLSNLNKGEVINLKCTGAGLVLLSPSLNDCMPLDRYREQLAIKFINNLDKNRDYIWAYTQLSYLSIDDTDMTHDSVEAAYLFITKMTSLSDRSCDKTGLECFKKIDIDNIPESAKTRFKKIQAEKMEAPKN